MLAKGTRKTTGEFIQWLTQTWEEEVIYDPHAMGDILARAIDRAKTRRGKEAIEDVLVRWVWEHQLEAPEEIESMIRGTRWEKYMRPAFRIVWERDLRYRMYKLPTREVARRTGYSRSTIYVARWLARKAIEEFRKGLG